MKNWLIKRRRTTCLICKKSRTKKNIKIATMKSSSHLNMQQLTEENYEVLNAAKDNGTTENIEEFDKFHQIMEYKKSMYINWRGAKHAYGTT